MSSGQEKKDRKKILIFPFNLLSHYLRCITLAEQYKQHEVLFAYSPEYYPFLLERGYACFKVDTFDAKTVMAYAAKFDFSWLNSKDIERITLSQAGIIKTLKPDFVIGDTCPTLKMAAEITGVKYVALMNGYMTPHYAFTRRLSRTHPAYGYLIKLPPRVAEFITSFAEKIAFRMVHQPFRRLRKKFHLKPVANYLHEMQGDDNLICDPPELFPQQHLPANYSFTGALLFNAGATENDLLPGIKNGKKVICVCMGSTGNWKELSFLSDKKYSAFTIITTGDQQGCISGEHVIQKQFVNLDNILPYCSLMICHGGNGTVHFGIKHKVYMLCLTSHFEQEWNVHRLESLGLAKCITDNPREATDAFLVNI